jgi:apolipoprotein D and lipocalin family protein
MFAQSIKRFRLVFVKERHTTYIMKIENKLNKAAPCLLAAGAIATSAFVIRSKIKTGLPKGAAPVSNFDVERYAGQWYEIARLDHHFEEGLRNVTANYKLKRNGSIKVVNRGQDAYTGKWSESTAKAKFIGDKHTGRLKVSFFGPFYAAYNIIAVDGDYQNALVAGHNLKYLWLLSRAPIMADDVRKEFLLKASALGYNIGKLVWTRQQAADVFPIATVS